MNNSLYSITINLLRNRSRRLTLDIIAEDTGLSRRWLEALTADKIPDPSVNRIQTLYEYLSKLPLKI